MTTLALISDLHIGAPDKRVKKTEGAADAKEAAYRAVVDLRDTILRSGADAVLCAGDVFDRHNHTPEALALAAELLTGFDQAGLPCAIIGGNHDAESPLPDKLKVQLPASAHWFDTAAAETLRWESLGLAVHGQSVQEKDDLRSLPGQYPAPDPALINIGLLHTSLTGEWSNRACLPTTVAELLEVGYQVWVLGHVHQRRVLSDSPLILYPGALHTRRVGEQGERGFSLLHVTPGQPLTAEHREV